MLTRRMEKERLLFKPCSIRAEWRQVKQAVTGKEDDLGTLSDTDSCSLFVPIIPTLISKHYFNDSAGYTTHRCAVLPKGL